MRYFNLSGAVARLAKFHMVSLWQESRLRQYLLHIGDYSPTTLDSSSIVIRGDCGMSCE